VIKLMASKTREIIANLESLRGDAPAITLEALQERKLPAGMDRFLFNLAVSAARVAASRRARTQLTIVARARRLWRSWQRSEHLCCMFAAQYRVALSHWLVVIVALLFPRLLLGFILLANDLAQRV
jgi:hypothetical protein